MNDRYLFTNKEGFNFYEACTMNGHHYFKTTSINTDEHIEVSMEVVCFEENFNC